MRNARAVTFDCWGTLLFERDPEATFRRRVERVRAAAWELGFRADTEQAHAALSAARERHVGAWLAGRATGAREIASWSLEALARAAGRDAPEPAVAEPLARGLSEALHDAEVRALEGARETLEALSQRGVRRALICDTGFADGSAVRRALERVGLFEALEVVVFSDEEGVPKPHPHMFERALAPLGLAGQAGACVHVGDLRRTDIAGARAAGMATVRIRHHYDDRSELRDADAVADSHVHLQRILGLEPNDTP